MATSRLFVVDKFPGEYASGIYINDRIWAQFSVPIASGTATYYNFTVNERDTYEPVEGTVSVQGISGGLSDTTIIFTPKYALKRDTSYSALISTGIKAKSSDDYLTDDLIWYFTTSNLVASGLIGSEDIIVPSGYTDPNDYSSTDGFNASGVPLTVMETVPAMYDINIPRDVPFIGIRLNAPIPSGINISDHVRLSCRRIFGW